MKRVSLSLKALDESEKAESSLQVAFFGYRLTAWSSSLSMTIGDGIPHRSLNFFLSRSQTFSEDCNNGEGLITNKRELELKSLLEDFSDYVMLRFYPSIEIKPKRDSSYYNYLEPYKISVKIVESLLDEIKLLHI